MTPDFCANCAKVKAPCASGLADAKGRRCPRFEHACRTFEGEAVWQAASRASGWSGGGMVPRRLDRAAIRARLPDIEGWVLDELMDAIEPAALAASAVAAERDKKRKGARPPEARAGARRAPRPPRPDDEEGS